MRSMSASDNPIEINSSVDSIRPNENKESNPCCRRTIRRATARCPTREDNHCTVSVVSVHQGSAFSIHKLTRKTLRPLRIRERGESADPSLHPAAAQTQRRVELDRDLRNPSKSARDSENWPSARWVIFVINLGRFFIWRAAPPRDRTGIGQGCTSASLPQRVAAVRSKRRFIRKRRNERRIEHLYWPECVWVGRRK